MTTSRWDEIDLSTEHSQPSRCSEDETGLRLRDR
ncbi:MAG: hypothetical protein JWP48_5061 [Actinoallomurus sp.]|jgi:hypothetical protein|nr:hypothetical protein [Actinoallomurus sp.]